MLRFNSVDCFLQHCHGTLIFLPILAVCQRSIIFAHLYCWIVIYYRTFCIYILMAPVDKARVYEHKTVQINDKTQHKRLRTFQRQSWNRQLQLYLRCIICRRFCTSVLALHYLQALCFLLVICNNNYCSVIIFTVVNLASVI